MQTYRDKEELIDAIEKTFNLFYNEFENIDSVKIHDRIQSVDKSPYEMIVYQNQFIEFIIPSPNYKWNQLGGLYQSFYDEYINYNFAEILALFFNSKIKFVAWIRTLTDEELFELEKRKWTITSANLYI